MGVSFGYSLLNFLLVLTFAKIAVVFTDWENHKFQKDWKRSVIYKTIPLAVVSSLLKPGYESLFKSLDEIRSDTFSELLTTTGLYGFKVKQYYFNFLYRPFYCICLSISINDIIGLIGAVDAQRRQELHQVQRKMDVVVVVQGMEKLRKSKTKFLRKLKRNQKMLQMDAVRTPSQNTF